MKTVFNIVLALCAVALVYVCYGSIMGPINFEKVQDAREKEIIARLIDIRKAQVEWRQMHEGKYTADFDSLIDFVKTAKLPFVRKEGSLTDAQLEAGMTEKKAMKLITMWVSVLDTIYPAGFNADSLKYVPFGNGATFEMVTRSDTTKSGAPLNLFQAQTPYETYMSDLDKQLLINLKDVQTKLGKYCGLRVGDIEQPNNNAGNWE